MFSYVFYDGMKLIQDAIRLPLAWMALCCGHHGALACTLLGETFQHKQGCRTTNSEDGFKLFNVYSYIIFGVGGGGVVKIIKRSRGGLN